MRLWPAIYDRLPEWQSLTYQYRDAGTPWEDVPGLSIRMGAKRDVTNCCVFTWAALLQGMADIGQPLEYDRALQEWAMVIDPEKHRTGAAGAAVRAGMARMISPDDYKPGVGPCVAQFWRKEGSNIGGHSLFLYACASDNGVHQGVWTMEANGRNDGSGPALGLDGVGCRVRAGDGTWRNLGRFPPLASLYRWGELREQYEEIMLARLVL